MVLHLKHPRPDHQQLIDRNLAGDYKFELKRILEQAWAATQHSKWTYFQMFVFMLALIFITMMVFYKVMGVNTPEDLTVDVQVTAQLIVQIVTAPFLAGLMMVGVRLMSQQPIYLSALFAYLPLSVTICFTALLLAILNGIAMRYFFPLAIYVAIATSFATMLIADKKMSPLASISLSVRMVNRYFLSFLLFFTIFFGLLLLVVFSFGLAIIFVGPLFFNAKGLLYKELFGYDTIDDTQRLADSEESTFDA